MGRDLGRVEEIFLRIIGEGKTNNRRFFDHIWHKSWRKSAPNFAQDDSEKLTTAKEEADSSATLRNDKKKG
jgi:hypothetical protein